MKTWNALLVASLFLTACGGGGDAPPPVDPAPMTAVSIRHGTVGKLMTEAILSNVDTRQFQTVEPNPRLPADVIYPWADFEPGEYEMHTRFDDGEIRGPVTVFVSGPSMTVDVP